MIYIFYEMAARQKAKEVAATQTGQRSTSLPAARPMPSAREQGRAVSDYILQRFAAVCDEVRTGDGEAVEYLQHLYERVLEDPRIGPGQRSLLSILDKLDEDLADSLEIYGPRAVVILDFLEADTLRHATSRSANDHEQRVLGRILWMRRRYFPEPTTVRRQLRPAEIRAYLDQHVIGQEAAKKALSTAVYGHGKRIRHTETRFASDIVLLIGPSGCGKTELMRRLREIVDVPMVLTDVSNLGAGQYRGRHKEDILIELYETAGRRKSVAEQGIVFLDEFDKLLLPAVSDRGVDVHADIQAQLLTMLEGSEVRIKVDRQTIMIDTSRILFVLAGAFEGIDACIRADKLERGHHAGNIGFQAPLVKEMNLDYVRENISHEVLMRYGMKRELAGRIASITVMERLRLEDMLRILTEPRESIVLAYQKEIRLSCGASLDFTEGALREVAERAMKDPTGARAMREILARTMLPILYRAPGESGLLRVVVNAAVVRGEAQAVYECGEGYDAGTDAMSESAVH